jgi:drug/metabolite transporter (DMT)-like permease
LAEPARKSPLWKVLGGWTAFILLETTIQVVFKIAGGTLDAAQGLGPLLADALTTPIVLLGFFLYFCGFIVWMTLLKSLDLGRAFPMTAMVYVMTLAAAVVFFHERPNAVRLLGILVIVGGVVLLAFDENSPPSE